MKRKEAIFIPRVREGQWVNLHAALEISRKRLSFVHRYNTFSEGWNANRHPWPVLSEDVHAPYGAIIGDICGSVYRCNTCPTEQPSKIEH
jgi:hypothetical protein